MSLFKVSRGSEANLPSQKTDGWAYFCTDTGSFFIDHLDSSDTLVRSKISANFADKLRYIQDGETVELNPDDIATHIENKDNPHGVTVAQIGAATADHKHDASTDITSGILPVSRGGTGNNFGYVRIGQKSGTNIGDCATAEGSETTASGNYAHAEGLVSTAFGSASHAEGKSANSFFDKVLNPADATIKDIIDASSGNGNNFSVAYGEASHVEGYNTKALNTDAHAEGCDTLASGYASHSEGGWTKAEGYTSHSEGYYTVADGNHAHAEGYGSVASGTDSHAEGNSTVAEGDCSHAEGQGTWAIGQSSHTEGLDTTANGEHSHAEGETSTAYGLASHAEGRSSQSFINVIPDPENATIEDIINAVTADVNFSVAYGDASHVEGYNTKALSNNSHAEGCGSIAAGSASHAEGFYTDALGDHSHAEGLGSVARGQDSHAEGNNSVAEGSYSHAEGCVTTANGPSSHAEGTSTTANGANSHSEGLGTIATGAAQHVQGLYNIEDTNEKFLHIVGNGTESARSNAHTLDRNGNAWFAGNIYSSNSTPMVKLQNTNSGNSGYLLMGTSSLVDVGVQFSGTEDTRLRVGRYNNGAPCLTIYHKADSTGQYYNVYNEYNNPNMASTASVTTAEYNTMAANNELKETTLYMLTDDTEEEDLQATVNEMNNIDYEANLAFDVNEIV